MSCKLVRLGNYIKIRKHANSELKFGLDDVMGVSITKNIIPTKAKANNNDLSKFLIVQKNDFVYNPRNALAVSMNTTDKRFIISWNNTCFYVDSEDLLPEFLAIFFRRKEYDNYVKFYEWGSSTPIFSWADMCDIEIPLPPIEKQREYVGIYGNLLKLSNNHEKSFADLQLITDTFIEKLVEKYGTKSLGGYIQITDTRNSDDALGKKDLRGISTSKTFIQSKANTTGVSFTNYKVVQPGQFAYVADTSRRGDKIALAYNDDKPYIISSIYTTFEVSDTEALLPEFLLLWFKRPEFDRYARYNSWGSARETFDWNEMQRVRLPIPPITVQQSIVAIYHALEARKRLTERLKTTIKEISPILIKDAKDKVELVA